ncbi:NYN domain-containing protein [Candidatus Parcubacteria bacterium]|nr:NYN domain-containing protein [Patescibacteria group bacterium]MBU4309711.1 NYN domain-containing protein [Patescibacteria group bacterium]MBU4431665.1 NYN domain-containing protein [Patescibacteria group bacterium]MBU4577901.1 NYN domain-containing protein [Patescibacteria group bacterium]MCG2696589.1 NYN domain-containing protein [Candidatus Parcubacteria bacterium]
MHYIIDANNLAGKLNILDKKDFDLELIEIVRDFFGAKKHRVDLIFDGRDNMGDKRSEGNLNIIYTPRDSYYVGADDKIVEMVNSDLEGLEHGHVFVITDDLELIERVQKVAEKIQIIKVSDFAKSILLKLEVEELEIEEELSEEEEDEITKELSNLWK